MPRTRNILIHGVTVPGNSGYGIPSDGTRVDHGQNAGTVLHGLLIRYELAIHVRLYDDLRSGAVPPDVRDVLDEGIFSMLADDDSDLFKDLSYDDPEYGVRFLGRHGITVRKKKGYRSIRQLWSRDPRTVGKNWHQLRDGDPYQEICYIPCPRFLPFFLKKLYFGHILRPYVQPGFDVGQYIVEIR